MQTELNCSIDVIVDVYTDREEYGVGDIVIIIFKNVCDEKVVIAGPCAFIYNDENKLIFDMCCFCLWEIEPGEFETIAWNQKDKNGEATLIFINPEGV